MPGKPLVTTVVEVPPFDQRALTAALPSDQAGDTAFPEFLEASWQAGVVRYEVDFVGRTVSYFGARDERYVEEYPAVTL